MGSHRQSQLTPIPNSTVQGLIILFGQKKNISLKLVSFFPYLPGNSDSCDRTQVGELPRAVGAFVLPGMEWVKQDLQDHVAFGIMISGLYMGFVNYCSLLFIRWISPIYIQMTCAEGDYSIIQEREVPIPLFWLPKGYPMVKTMVMEGWPLNVQ